MQAPCPNTARLLLAACMDTRNCLAPRNKHGRQEDHPETLRLPRAELAVKSDPKFPHYTLNTYMNSQGLGLARGGKKGTNT